MSEFEKRLGLFHMTLFSGENKKFEWKNELVWYQKYNVGYRLIYLPFCYL